MDQRPKLSPVKREILRHNLRAIVDDMSIALEHNSPSETVSEARDYAVAFTNASGEVVVAENPFHIPSLALTAQAVLDYYEFNLRAGDLVVTNDPYRGGTQTQDLTVFAPVYATEELVGCLLVRVHMPDFGGQIVGGYNPPALEVWAEGVRIIPIKLARFGRLDRDIHQTVLLNSRVPDQTRGLLDAMLATLALGQERVQRMLARYGFEPFVEGLEYALDYSEAATRTLIRDWSPGVFHGQATLGHDCAERSPVVRCQLEVRDGQVTLDFSGSDAQSPSFMNSAWGASCGSALLPLISLLGDDLPMNSGVLRVVRFQATEGSLVRPAYPAAVGWGQAHPGSEIINAVSGALSACTDQPLPRMPTQALVQCCFAKYRIFSLDALIYPGAASVDGVNGWGPPGYSARRKLPSVEKCEIAFPEISIERLEIVSDGRAAEDGHGAPASEVRVALRQPASVTACLNGPPDETGPERRPVFSIQTEDAELCVDTFCADRRLASGVLTLRTAGGGHTSRAQAEAQGKGRRCSQTLTDE